MNIETFNQLLDELDGNSLETLKKKNAKYASPEDCLHNFDAGAEIMGKTPAQCTWGYMTKHLVALRDKVEKNDFTDREDLLEKCQDIINYIRFIWLIGNAEENKKTKPTTAISHTLTNNTNYHVEDCNYYHNGKCWGTKECEICNYIRDKGCRYYDSYGGRR